MVLGYQAGDKLKVPVESFDRIQKYSSAEGARPGVDRLGSGTWEKTKSRVKKAMRDMADELLKLYAARKAVAGHSFAPDTHWQEEFEGAFPYDLTTDQRLAAAARAKATGKPMAVILHNLVGLLHACMAIYYAYLDRVPIFIIGATGPMDEAKRRGWDEIDVVFISGDAYIDHPSFATAILGRVLEACGFRVGIVAQPDWQSCEPWKTFGRPRLFFAISAGNMDSMINHYTANKKVRNDDAYSPGGRIGLRPDRATLAYSRKLRWSDGVTRQQAFLERPQLLIENGVPTHLFCATAEGIGNDLKDATRTWNAVIPLAK